MTEEQLAALDRAIEERLAAMSPEERARHDLQMRMQEHMAQHPLPPELAKSRPVILTDDDWR
jgi:hypothetical protein